MIPLLSMVNNLLFAGMTAGQILNFVGKKIKGLEKGIEQARGTGYNDNDILKFISGKMPKGNSKEAHSTLNEQEQYLKNAGLKTKQEKQESKRKGISTALNVGAIGLGSYGLYKAYTNRFPKGEWDFTHRQVPENALQIEGKTQKQIPYTPGMEKGPIGPNQFQMVPPGNPIKPQGMAPITNTNQPIQPPQKVVNQALQPTQNIPVPTPDQPIAPALPEQPIGMAPSDVIRNTKLDALVDSMARDKVSPEEISEYITNSYPEYAKNVEGQTKEPLINSIYRYLGKKQKKPGLVPGLEQQLNQQYGKQDGTQLASNQSQIEAKSSQEIPIQPQGNSPIQDKNVIAGKDSKAAEENKKENGDVVQLPDGQIGTIESLKKDHAVVEIDGKKRPVKLDQLEDVPIKKKDLADLHEDLIKGIEEEIGSDVSRNVNWAGYDPKTNRLSYLPHDGALYVYDDIGPEDVKMLTDILSTRKSSGGNFIGPWLAGTKSPIGAAMSALIKKLQSERGGKGSEYSGKFETLYSHLEPAVKAAKAKKKKK